MTIKELKKLIKYLPNDMQVLTIYYDGLPGPAKLSICKLIKDVKCDGKLIVPANNDFVLL